MNEDKLRLDQDKAQQAKELLDNELFQTIFTDFEADVIETLANCPVRDTEGRDILLMSLQVGRRVKGVLTGYIETGKLATANLQPPKPTLVSKIKQAF